MRRPKVRWVPREGVPGDWVVRRRDGGNVAVVRLIGGSVYDVRVVIRGEWKELCDNRGNRIHFSTIEQAKATAEAALLAAGYEFEEG